MYEITFKCENRFLGRCGCICLLPQALSKRVVCEVRALAVLPTKELAQQVLYSKWSIIIKYIYPRSCLSIPPSSLLLFVIFVFQVSNVFSSYAEGTVVKVVMIAGQKSFAEEQALLSKSRGGVSCSLADIVVATPGRLVDHINKHNNFSLRHLRFLVSSVQN